MYKVILLLLVSLASVFGEVNHKLWAKEIIALRSRLVATKSVTKYKQPVRELMKRFPYQTDWFLQDNQNNLTSWLKQSSGHQLEQTLVKKLLNNYPNLIGRFEELSQLQLGSDDTRWLQLYAELAEKRREKRLRKLLKQQPSLIFTKQKNYWKSFYAYTEGQSDAQGERHFVPDSELCAFKLSSLYGSTTTLLKDKTGRLRDPDVSYDGQRVLFSWKKSDREDDYHLYEMRLSDRSIRKLTSGLGFADYEGIYTPDDHIIFASTRCVTTVDCWITEVSNLYKCDLNGNYMRRLGFDQVHTNYPKIMNDGKVVYTRWDYNDRGQVFPQPLFQMNYDGTAQTEFYGNNSWFPTSLLHARPIPNSSKMLAIASGHHTNQQGKLCIVDPSKGRQEATGIQLIAPVRETKTARVDAWGQHGDQFCYPLPISEHSFITSYAPLSGPRFLGIWRIYWMDKDGNRELLITDPKLSCTQAVFLKPRSKPPLRSSEVDLTKKDGYYYVQDVYLGQSMQGVKRGTVKELRVVELIWKSSPIGKNYSRGPAGSAQVCLPSAVANGAWDIKKILGSATVHEDGSAYFKVPANTPVYFQLLDEKGYVVQTMRSWSTLMPNETFGCVGCHEDKNNPPPTLKQKPIALNQPPEKLKLLNLPARGFSFPEQVQPILDKHCISCHNNSDSINRLMKNKPIDYGRCLTSAEWRFTTEKPNQNWNKPDYNDDFWMQSKSPFGSRINQNLTPKTSWKGKNIWLRQSIKLSNLPKHILINVAHDEDLTLYINGTKAYELSGYTTEYKQFQLPVSALKLLKKGNNLIAVHCSQTIGGQFVDLQFFEQVDKKGVFSLLSKAVNDKVAKRRWSEAYVNLTQSTKVRGALQGHPNKMVNWVSSQSAPTLLASKSVGSHQSGIMKLLENGHGKTKLSKEEIRIIATWIDLGVPYCGDYKEHNLWSDKDKKQYSHFLEKRHKMEQEIEQNVKDILHRKKKNIPKFHPIGKK